MVCHSWYKHKLAKMIRSDRLTEVLCDDLLVVLNDISVLKISILSVIAEKSQETVGEFVYQDHGRRHNASIGQAEAKARIPLHHVCRFVKFAFIVSRHNFDFHIRSEGGDHHLNRKWGIIEISERLIEVREIGRVYFARQNQISAGRWRFIWIRQARWSLDRKIAERGRDDDRRRIVWIRLIIRSRSCSAIPHNGKYAPLDEYFGREGPRFRPC